MPRKGTKAELAAFAREYRKRFPWRMALSNARNRSKRSGLPFDLTEEHVKKIFETGVCAYCGITVRFGGDIKQFSTHLHNRTGSLDKIDPVLGYTIGNVALSCMGCNSRKGDLMPIQLRRLADRIEEVQKEAKRGVRR